MPLPTRLMYGVNEGFSTENKGHKDVGRIIGLWAGLGYKLEIKMNPR